MKIKRSFGLACCRINLITHRPEIIMMKKKYTYAFFEFVFGKFKKKEHKKLIKMFNQMTQHEKMDILSLEYDKMWRRLRINIPNEYDEERKVYNSKKKRFENDFLQDGGKKLKNLINGTISLDCIWEIPKGRINDDEKPLNTAIREFKEETNISISDYKILCNLEPIKESYTIGRTKYEHRYFIAVANKFNWNPVINFKSYEQISEVENIKWVCENEIEFLNVGQNSYHRTKKVFKQCIKSFKGYYSKCCFLDNALCAAK